MRCIGADDAQTHLSRLLDDVAAGASFTITRRGRPVARLVGVRGEHRDPDEILAAFAGARTGRTLEMPLWDAIAEARR
ncbi:type II toxin-antitoxin system Phd/YefM family antitoxin [Mobilicoccus massiliensis]|uniref:type II toxin-antitoxin system Phd/YefM family antitoxin n=1 Tax=Mobilicoccus massiliensis TaxID=1522310 RepID=UPI00058B4104